jgi:plasmid stabilization system protein ParE
MLPYELTPLAEEDLKGIAQYTVKKWGVKQSLRYAELLENRFIEIADRIAYSRSFSKRYPQVMVSRCEHHYIFYIHPNEKVPCIIAVLHEKMDMLVRLENRLA